MIKDIFGGPGTVPGLVLRIAQCFFAAASVSSITRTRNFFSVTAFCYVIASMCLQGIWSFSLMVVDAYACAKKKNLQNPLLLSLFVIGDWVTSTLSLAGAASSGGVTVLYFHDSGGSCSIGLECTKMELAVIFAFLSWIFTALSWVIEFWLLAFGFNLG